MTDDSQSFEWLNLDEGEKVVWSGNPRMMSILPSIVVGIPMIALFGIGLLVIAGAYLSVKNTEFVVTTNDLYVKKGIMSRSVKKVGFDKVQNISFSQGVLGKQFGYGHIEISTAGGSGVEMRFRNIVSPKEVQQKINNQIKKGQAKETSHKGRTRKEILEEILSEVQQINSKL
jgi:uncharacterized membrane protein YdbT with pleckstrin-like domain